MKPSTWSDASTWTGEGLRREVFFFESSGIELYGSIYAPLSTPHLGVVFCNSWGIEGDQGSRLAHPLALAVAAGGGVAALFHYPGFGDSRGDVGEATMGRFADAARDAVGEASRRHPGLDWMLAGLMLGASVASLAVGRDADVGELLFVQPLLRPGRYFARLRRASRSSIGRAASGGPSGSAYAFGYPLPDSMLASAPAADSAVEEELAAFAGAGTIVRHQQPAEIVGAPARFQSIFAPGTWRFGSTDSNHADPALLRVAADWLDGRLETEEASSG
jgi:alpha-beta hydrolase superfamily lysophospholipase